MFEFQAYCGRLFDLWSRNNLFVVFEKHAACIVLALNTAINEKSSLLVIYVLSSASSSGSN